MKKKVFLVGTLLLAGAVHATPPRPEVTFKDGPLKPSKTPLIDESVLLGYSSAQAGSQIDKFRYAPLEDGGFRLIDKENRIPFNRSIVMGRNVILTGDLPIFKIKTGTGSGVYPHAKDRCFPLFGRKDEALAQVQPTLGEMRIGVPTSKGVQWFDKAKSVETTFYPGYTSYEIAGPDNAWNAHLTITPTLPFHGFVCRVEFSKPTPLFWTYGNMYWGSKPEGKTTVKIENERAKITSSEFPKGVVYVGWDGRGRVSVKKLSDGGNEAQFKSTSAQKTYYLFGTWGVESFDQVEAKHMMDRMDSPQVASWKDKIKELKKQWFVCYIGRALHPKKNMVDLERNPAATLKASVKSWGERRNEFQIKTPDPYFNAIVNFQRCASEYHRLPPGLVLSSSQWMMYSHISVGWYGRIWSGEAGVQRDYLRMQAAFQSKDGYINWISPSLAAYEAENNNPYWVDQVWWTYQWTGDKVFLSDLWPAVKKAVEHEQKTNDPDNDGLFRSSYEYWNCDSNGKGPKAATPTATAWNMYRNAAKIARVVGDAPMAKIYEKQAEKIKKAAFKELWNDKVGILGSIGGNNIWRSHPQTWEQYLPIIYGMLPPDKGLRAMRWLDAHYGFQPEENVRLLMNCDWWPIRWSVHWVPVGDSLLAAQAGMKCGDTELWWPYVQTVARASFRSDAPAVRFGISNTGSGSSEIEDVDADDPHSQIAVRGIFGVEPDLPNQRLLISPTFPNSWTNASLRMPNLSISYSRTGNQCTLRIETPEPLVKVVRGRLDLTATNTPAEKVSVITYTLPEKAPVPPVGPKAPQIMVDKDPRKPLPEMMPEDEARQVRMDLSGAYNTTLRKMVKEIRFTADTGGDTTVETWWHTVPGETGEGPEEIESADGTRYLLRGRTAAAKGNANNLIALSSWQHGTNNPLPAAATIPIGRKVKSIRLLMQNYVSPIKNYIPNGEIVLHYKTGEPDLIQLIPPYNLDAYFQAFAREGASVPLGTLTWGSGWTPCSKDFCKAQAQELPVQCDPNRVLESIEIRATVSEGILGITAITLIPAL